MNPSPRKKQAAFSLVELLAVMAILAILAGVVAAAMGSGQSSLQTSLTQVASIGTFGAAYMTVVLLEPLVDLAVLALVKQLHRLKGSLVVVPRLHNAA